MLLIKFELLDGCNYSRSYCEKVFKDKKEFEEYEKNMNDAMYEIIVDSIENI